MASKKQNSCFKNGFFTGLTAGLLVAFLSYTSARPDAFGGLGHTLYGEEPSELASKTTSTPGSEASKPRFDFYSYLPGMGEPVPEKDVEKTLASSARSRNIAANNTTSGQLSFMLQVGSFQNHSEADRQKAKLAFLGMQAKIQKVTIDNNRTWHRVLIGPLDSRSLKQHRNTLQQNSVSSVVLKLKG